MYTYIHMYICIYIYIYTHAHLPRRRLLQPVAQAPPAGNLDQKNIFSISTPPTKTKTPFLFKNNVFLFI